MRGACFLGLMLVVVGLPSCGKKKPPASTVVVAPKPPPDPNQEAGERVQREVEVGYLYAGIPAVNALPGEDLDGDGTIGVDDLLQLLGVYGVACGDCPEDLDGSGVVDIDDLLQLLSVYGTDC